MRISIFGLGYVGAVSLACFARDGHQITGVDPDQAKLDLINSGTSPIVEPGVQDLIRAGVAAGQIVASGDPALAIRNSDVSFICVGTPSDSLGNHDLRAIRRVSEQIGAALRDKPGAHHVVVVRSTLPPGVVAEVIVPILQACSGLKEGKDFDVCFQPEFLREGSSIADFDAPPFTVIGRGSARPHAEALLRDLFGRLPCELIFTDLPTAEMLKFCCNAFHAMKVTFANEVGRLSKNLSIDGRAVMNLLCQDRQLNVSTAYLKPGFAFGGSCLPKDLRALVRIARERNVAVPMLGGILGSNRAHIDHGLEMILAQGRQPVALIGLSFKNGTDDLRESPFVAVAEAILGKGLPLRIYDPHVQLARLRGSNRKFIEGAVPHLAELLETDLARLISDSKTIVVGYKSAEVLAALRACTPSHAIVDLCGLADLPAGPAYHGVCW